MIRPTISGENLGLVLPPRSGRNFSDYLAIIEGVFQDVVHEEPKTVLTEMVGRDVLIFSASAEDSGQACSLFNVNLDSLILKFGGGRPRKLAAVDERMLVIIGDGDLFYAFFAKFHQIYENFMMLSIPVAVYRRAVRKSMRIPLTSPLQVLCRDGMQYEGKLKDFSATGARFIMPTTHVSRREVMLIEFAVADCGVCEMVAQVARTENLSSGTRSQVAVRMVLTKMMQKKMEYLFLCYRKAHLASA